MFCETKVGALFPSHVWLHYLDQPEALNKVLAEKILAMKESLPSQSKYKGMWQSKGDFHTLAEAGPLTAAIQQAALGVVGFKGWVSEGLAITDCWANVNRDDFSLYEHSHPNNFISGVYYARAPKDCGDIVFHDPRPAAQVMMPAVKTFNPNNSQKHRVTPEEGLLLLFESWLPHSVEANTCGEERISIAFNLTLTGKVGRPSGRMVVADDQRAQEPRRWMHHRLCFWRGTRCCYEAMAPTTGSSTARARSLPAGTWRRAPKTFWPVTRLPTCICAPPRTTVSSVGLNGAMRAAA